MTSVSAASGIVAQDMCKSFDDQLVLDKVSLAATCSPVPRGSRRCSKPNPAPTCSPITCSQLPAQRAGRTGPGPAPGAVMAISRALPAAGLAGPGAFRGADRRGRAGGGDVRPAADPVEGRGEQAGREAVRRSSLGAASLGAVPYALPRNVSA